MNPLGDYLREQQELAVEAAINRGDPGPYSVPAQEAVHAFQEFRPDVSTTDAAKFGETVDQFLMSQEFAQLVNQAVPPPESGESEDQFVARAKEAIREALLKKFEA